MTKRIGITRGAFTKRFHKIVEELGHSAFNLIRKNDVSQCDIIIFSGGSDINPQIYNQENTHSYISQYSIARDMLEISILKKAMNFRKKILGVCRGHQLINAALGGNLIQEVSIIQKHPGNHKLNSTSGLISHFFDKVNSIHHQGVLEPGRNLEPTSYFGGVIESTEGENIISVQWHPEAMIGKDAKDFFEFVIEHWS